MAEALSVECPTTQDGQTSQMNHPSMRIREFLKKQQHRRVPPSNDSRGADTESGNSGDEQQRAQDNQSPPPNCSICLGRVKSKCFTDSCMHQFCFSCLLEWSKVKPECPLCKQTFKSIIHNVTSMDSYDEYKVEEQQRHVNWINITNTLQPLDFILSAGLPTYRLAINRVQRPELPQNRFFQLFLNETPLTERFARTYPNDAIPPRFSGATWRAYCYHRRLHAIPINGGTFGGHGPHVRAITAQFYRENPAQLHRLIPWLNRELVSLCPTTPHSIPYLLQSIENLLQTHDMTSREFRRRIRQFIPNYTDHFVHELINFARSPYDIIGYDRAVAYNPVFEDDRVIMLSSSSSDESDIEFVIDMRATNVDVRGATATNSGASTSTENTASTSSASATTSAPTSAATSVIDSNNRIAEMIRRNLRMLSANEGHLVTPPSVRALEEDETDSGEEEITNYLHTKPTVSNDEIIRGRQDGVASPAPVASNNNQSSSRTSDQTVIVSRNSHSSNATISVPSPAAVTVVVTHHSAAAATNTMNVNAIAATTVADDSDSDSDDCQFVCAKKPPHLRTPEFVELNSESDSDVVFVDEMLLTGQAIKTEKNGKSKGSNIIIPPAGPSAVSSTNILSSGRRKRRHQNGDDSNASASNQIDGSPENLTSAACATILETPLTAMTMVATSAATLASATPTTTDAIEIKPSTSSQWKVPLDAQLSTVDLYQSANRPNAIVFNRNIQTQAMPFFARKSVGGGKRIFEANSSSDDERSSGAELSSSSSTSNSSSDSDEIQSSSHEEYVVSANTRKRKPSADVTTRATRKRYRKKVNTKQIAARKKKNSKSPIKPKRASKHRSKLPLDTTSSSDVEHSD